MNILKIFRIHKYSNIEKKKICYVVFEASRRVGEISSKEADSLLLVHSVQVNKHKNMFNKYEKELQKKVFKNFTICLKSCLFACLTTDMFMFC